MGAPFRLKLQGCGESLPDLSAGGIPEPEARRRVAVELGLSQVREEVRDVWLTRWFRDFLYDLRFSARSSLRSPGFTAATLLSLALGIGATTAVYSLVDQVILHALPVRDPGRLVLVDWNGDDLITYATGSFNLMPYPICRDLQQQTRFLEGVLCRAEIEVEAIRLRGEGKSWRSIAHALNLPMSTEIDACRRCSENLPRSQPR